MMSLRSVALYVTPLSPTIPKHHCHIVIDFAAHADHVFGWMHHKCSHTAHVTTAAAFPSRLQLTLIISMVGCITSGVLGMILPVVIDFHVRRKCNLPISWRRWLMGQVCILAGIICITVANIYTVLDMIKPPVLLPWPKDFIANSTSPGY